MSALQHKTAIRPSAASKERSQVKFHEGYHSKHTYECAPISVKFDTEIEYPYHIKCIHTRITVSDAHEILKQGWNFQTDMKCIFSNSWMFHNIYSVLKNNAKWFESPIDRIIIWPIWEAPNDLIGQISVLSAFLAGCQKILLHHNYMLHIMFQINAEAADDYLHH